MTRPPAKALGDSIKCQFCRNASVAPLLDLRSPQAVVRRVVSVVVDSLYRVLGCWSRPHIATESSERLSPPRADAYSSPAISRVTCTFFASLDHARPNAIKWVRGVTFRKNLRSCPEPAFSVTPATHGSSAAEVTGRYRFRGPAVTSTKPVPFDFSALICSRMRQGNHDKTAEAFAGNVDVFSHGDIVRKL